MTGGLFYINILLRTIGSKSDGEPASAANNYSQLQNRRNIANLLKYYKSKKSLARMLS